MLLYTKLTNWIYRDVEKHSHTITQRGKRRQTGRREASQTSSQSLLGTNSNDLIPKDLCFFLSPSVIGKDHSASWAYHVPAGCWKLERNQRTHRKPTPTWGEHAKLHTDSNLITGSSQAVRWQHYPLCHHIFHPSVIHYLFRLFFKSHGENRVNPS